MKKRKFSLQQLKVKSFVTNMVTAKKETIKGGVSSPNNCDNTEGDCYTMPINICNSNNCETMDGPYCQQSLDVNANCTKYLGCDNGNETYIGQC